MRISDWSSDVCSSDLVVDAQELDAGVHALHRQRERTPEAGIRGRLVRKGADHALAAGAEHDRAAEAVEQRKAVEEREIVGSSEESRVGNECARTRRSRWSTYH